MMRKMISRMRGGLQRRCRASKRPTSSRGVLRQGSESFDGDEKSKPK